MTTTSSALDYISAVGGDQTRWERAYRQVSQNDIEQDQNAFLKRARCVLIRPSAMACDGVLSIT